jgi:hypothetical protein
MTPSSQRSLIVIRCAAIAGLCVGLPLGIRGAPPPPDPCKLITVSELEQIVGPLKGRPVPGDIKAGDVSCEYTPANGPAWISIRLQEGELPYWKSRNGGKSPVSLPELGKDAFVNPDSDGGSTDLFAKKGILVVRVSAPKGPTAIDKVKAIAKVVLSRP